LGAPGVAKRSSWNRVSDVRSDQLAALRDGTLMMQPASLNLTAYVFHSS